MDLTCPRRLTSGRR